MFVGTELTNLPRWKWGDFRLRSSRAPEGRTPNDLNHDVEPISPRIAAPNKVAAPSQIRRFTALS